MWCMLYNMGTERNQIKDLFKRGNGYLDCELTSLVAESVGRVQGFITL
jgi:hypothetical protein